MIFISSDHTVMNLNLIAFMAVLYSIVAVTRVIIITITCGLLHCTSHGRRYSVAEPPRMLTLGI